MHHVVVIRLPWSLLSLVCVSLSFFLSCAQISGLRSTVAEQRVNAVAQRSIVAEQSSTIVALVSTIAAQDSGITAQGSYLVELANRLEAFNASLQSNGTMCPGVRSPARMLTCTVLAAACCRLLSLAVCPPSQTQARTIYHPMPRSPSRCCVWFPLRIAATSRRRVVVRKR